MAQGLLESGNGNSTLARKSNNHFGIKCKGDWKGRSVRHDDDAPKECFRAYRRVEDSYADHANFLDSSPRYDSLFRFAPTDYRSWARGLKNAGYATAPDYTPRLIKIIEDNKLYLLDGSKAPIPAPSTSAKQVATTLPKQKKNPNQKSIEREAQREGQNIDPNSFRVTVNSVNGYNLYRTNKSIYINAKGGDTYKSIARKFDVSPSALRRFNDIKGRDTEPKAGDVIYIESKRSRWMGITREHKVSQGESLYSISQRYGISLSSLRSRNNLSKGDEPKAGSILKLK